MARFLFRQIIYQPQSMVDVTVIAFIAVCLIVEGCVWKHTYRPEQWPSVSGYKLDVCV